MKTYVHKDAGKMHMKIEKPRISWTSDYHELPKENGNIQMAGGQAGCQWKNEINPFFFILQCQPIPFPFFK